MLLTLLKCYFIYQTAVLADEKGCLHPGPKLHTIEVISNDDQKGLYPVNTTISYSCDPGYEIFNNESRRCLENGSWSGTEPYCGLNVATIENIETIKFWANDQIYRIFDHDTKVPIENTSTTTWIVKLNKTYTIDILKLTFEVDRSTEAINPDVSYSSEDIRSGNETVDYWRIASTMVSIDCQPISTITDIRKTAVYQCPIKSPKPSQLMSFQIHWPVTSLQLHNISLYTSPGRSCFSVNGSLCKRVVYGDKCYDLITDLASWSDSEKACRSYHMKGSTLASFSKGDVDMLNYFQSVVSNTELRCIEGFWTTDKYNKSDYRMIRFSPVTFVPKDPHWKQHHGRICEYDVSQCVIPGNSTQMSIYCASQQKEMKKYIIGLTAKIVAIVIIVQWLVVASIFFYLKYKIPR